MSDVLPGFDPPPATVTKDGKHRPDSTPRRLNDAAMIRAGIHPATKMPLADNGETCGDCAMLRLKQGTWWKCGTPDPRSKNHRGDGRDMTKRWPACIAFVPKTSPEDAVHPTKGITP